MINIWTRTILHDSEQARFERENAPGLTYCGICGRPWNMVRPHSIRVSERRGCFAQCENCWKEATDHEIELCNELLCYDRANAGLTEEQIGYSKEHLMRCVRLALDQRRSQEGGGSQ